MGGDVPEMRLGTFTSPWRNRPLTCRTAQSLSLKALRFGGAYGDPFVALLGLRFQYHAATMPRSPDRSKAGSTPSDCQSASNRDPGSASKKDPPAGRVDDHRRRDRRRGAGQGERSGVDLVSSLPPVRSRRAAAGFLRSASSTASWRCRSPGYRSGVSAGRAAPWSSSRRRTRSATRQTAGSSSRSPRCVRRVG